LQLSTSFCPPFSTAYEPFFCSAGGNLAVGLGQQQQARMGWGPDSRLGEGVREKIQGLTGLKAQFDVAFWALGVAGCSPRSTRLSCFCS